MHLVPVLTGVSLLTAFGLAPWIQRPFLFEIGRGSWPLFRRPQGARNVYITFDDGPHPENTPALLDALGHAHTKATFFVLTECARQYPSLVREIIDRGHSLGSHGYSHRHLFLRRRSTLQREVVEAVEDLEEVAHRTISLFRPPYGVRDARLYSVLKKHGLRPVFWDILTYDWRNPPAQRIAAKAANAARPGSIILLHDGGGCRSSTVAAIPELVDKLRKKSLDPVGMI
jgi:peptidoglycan/xylan/chitin deacetylase (PgdA/CDA1 family)